MVRVVFKTVKAAALAAVAVKTAQWVDEQLERVWSDREPS